ncbi:hypothetical protein [Herbidospora mongoliensis]|uniref:hypothetical protein n=1 Tax=Herbidospora mongoliensis TaxID=688067 RepID=UPI000833E3DE|nr:hypothetical protein [Herbidospora mongoliensis]
MWHDSYVLVVLVLAAFAVVGCVVWVSMGQGGAMAEFPPDVPPLELPDAAQVTAVDLVTVQFPVGLVGYHTGSVDETLQRAATAIRDRDTRIAVLEQKVAELMTDRLKSVYAPPAEPQEQKQEQEDAW